MKKQFKIVICAAIIMVLALMCFLVPTPVRAEESDQDYSSVTVNDGQFNQKGSNILSSSPNWVGSSVGDFDESVIAGIIDLGTDSVSKENFLETTGLDLYDEYDGNKPVSPFGKNERLYPGTNSCVLMINTNNRTSTARGTAYGYTSDAISLLSNSFYKFTAWVKTGSFAQDSGAVIKLSGFEKDIGFWNIDTSEINVKSDATNGFRRYTIYVATAQNSVTANIKLQVGDAYSFGVKGEPDYFEHIHPSEGYAFFDNVTCTRLSANAFNRETSINSDKICVYDAEKEAVGILRSNSEVVSFENGLKDLKKGFKEDTDSGRAKYADTYDAGQGFDPDNIIGLTADPYTYKGNDATVADRNILILKADKPANLYFETKDFVVERNKFYRLSAWVKTQDFSNGNAALVVVGENNIPSNEYELSPVVISDITSSDDMFARYGWQKYSFYFKGSYSKDCKVRLQCWLGYSSNCTGTVMFDDIEFSELTYDYYSSNHSGGTDVNFDGEPSTTVTNGRFFNAESYKEETLWKPVEWNTLGELPEGAASGIILTDKEHYNNNITKYFGVSNPVSQASNVDINSKTHPTVLLLASRNKGYFGYSSPAISIAASNEYKISVTMFVTETTGSGANLSLIVDGKEISSIKNITGTHNNFETFDFFLQGDEPFSSGTGTSYSATLGITLGRSDEKASGNIYVTEVAFTTLDEGVYDEKLEAFKTERRFNPNYDMYSFRSFDFYGYDNADKNTIKRSTSWGIISSSTGATDGNNYNYRHGVFDPHYKDDNYDGGNIPDYVTRAYDNFESETKFGLVYTIQTFNSAVTSQLINPIRLEADAYYMVTVNMAVMIENSNPETSYGASIALVGDESYESVKYSDIKTTKNFKGELEFRPYQFYIQTADTTTALHLNISLGDNTYSNRYVTGSLYIAEFTVENLGGSEDDIEESDQLKIIDNHVSADEADTDNTDEDNTDDEENTDETVNNDSEKWWLIPSILFGIAIVLAVVGTAIRFIVDKSKRKQKKHQLNSYDRRFGTAEPEDNSSFDDNGDEQAPIIEQDIESFNDEESFNDDNSKVEPKSEEKEPEEAKPVQKKTPKSKKTEEKIDDFDE